MGHYKTGNILVVGDTHIPNEKPGYLDFCIDVRKRYKCDHVVHIGDVVDFHGVSYHESELDAPTASVELQEARKHLKDWKAAFRNVKVCYGNHDLLVARKAKTCGLPIEFFKTLNQILELPESWVWKRDHEVNEVYFFHGTGFSGKYPHANAMFTHRRNTCTGHCHAVSGTYFGASKKDLLWGMAVGSGVDDESIVFDYGRELPRKSIISCGVILENGKIPLTIPMEL